MPNQPTVYLDHSATTPTDPRVVEAMMPYFTEVYGNSSSGHGFGRQAERAIEDARETIARILNCNPAEIIFTSGGSESDNLAIRGAAWARKQQGTHLITSPVEHSAVSNTVKQLGQVAGFDYTVLPVDQWGMVDVEDFTAACRQGTTFASVIYANNEVGTIQPIPRLAEAANERGIVFHTDAVQAAGQLPLDVQSLGVDMLSISAHKFYGPKGVGALFIRDGVDYISNQTGGSHEHGFRAGTHNTPFIVGMAKALELAYAEREQHLAHYRDMRDMLIDGILSRVPNSALTGQPDERIPSHASFVFPGADSGKLVMHLDMRGVAASGGSACKTGNPEPSSVLLAMGYNEADAISGLRLTVGRQTTADEIEYAVNVVTETVEKLRTLERELHS